MLRFTTTTPFSLESSIDELLNTRPLVKVDKGLKLIEGKIKGKEAEITGKALELSGFYLPCFFEGDITELDKKEQDITMVLPTGEYEIKAELNEKGIYQLNLKK